MHDAARVHRVSAAAKRETSRAPLRSRRARTRDALGHGPPRKRGDERPTERGRPRPQTSGTWSGVAHARAALVQEAIGESARPGPRAASPPAPPWSTTRRRRQRPANRRSRSDRRDVSGPSPRAWRRWSSAAAAPPPTRSAHWRLETRCDAICELADRRNDGRRGTCTGARPPSRRPRSRRTTPAVSISRARRRATTSAGGPT
jgi:hypothetical protein